MRSRATLQKNTPVNNNSGGQKDVWSDVCSFRCRITQKKSQRSLEQEQPVNNKSYELFCRAQQKLIDNVSYDAQIIFNGEPYVINSFDLQEENKVHWYVMIICKNGS